MVSTTLTYALGRPPGAEEAGLIDALDEHFVRSGHSFEELLVGIVLSPAFRWRRGGE